MLFLHYIIAHKLHSEKVCISNKQNNKDLVSLGSNKFLLLLSFTSIKSESILSHSAFTSFEVGDRERNLIMWFKVIRNSVFTALYCKYNEAT
jgi:hypothetical protein